MLDRRQAHRQPIRQHWAVRYGLPCLLVTLVMSIDLALESVFGSSRPYLLPALAIVASAWAGGLVSGIVASVLSALVIDYVFLEPRQSLGFVSLGEAIEMTVFVIQGFLISWICSRMQSAEAKSKRQTQQILSGQDQLFTESQKLATARADAESRETILQLISDSLPAAIAYIDTSQRYLFCNHTYAKWYGKSKEAIIGESVKNVTGLIFDRILNEMQASLMGKSMEFEKRLPYHDQERDVQVHIVPVQNKEGKTKGIVVLLTDISEHKKIETQLYEAKALADAASLAKSAFLANMSHEIRTPLGAVMGFSELLNNPDLKPAEREHYIAIIKRNGEMLSNIISDILDISKIEAGKLEIERRDIRLEDILSDIKSLLQLQAREKGIELTVIADPGLPQFIHSDPLRLRQILINVVGNAVKFTQQGKVELLMRLTGEPAGKQRLECLVRDTGPGIEQAKFSSLFQPFTQADASTTRRYGGTGLGLALSKRLAQLLGGDIVLDKSVVGEGSSFIITTDPGYVAGVAQQAYEQGLPKIPPAVAEGSKLAGLKLLLVEDAPDNQMLIGYMLRLAGAEVDMAQHGREAITKAMAKEYDLILMDLQMPVMDGFAATSELRRLGYRKPIVALTAHAMKEERARCLASGFNEHVGKPIDRALLLDCVARLALTSETVLSSHG